MFPWSWYTPIVAVVAKVVTIIWKKGISTSNIATGTSKSATFNSSNVNVFDIDSGDKVFSTNNDMIISDIKIQVVGAATGVTWELGYGTIVDSRTGWTKLWGNAGDANIIHTIPRDIFLPKGNYITLFKTSGTDTLRWEGSITISQTVTADSNLNDDMEGNAP